MIMKHLSIKEKLIQLQWDNSSSLGTGVILKFLELFRSYFVEFVDDISIYTRRTFRNNRS